jgi:hypothetical protein
LPSEREWTGENAATESEIPVFFRSRQPYPKFLKTERKNTRMMSRDTPPPDLVAGFVSRLRHLGVTRQLFAECLKRVEEKKDPDGCDFVLRLPGCPIGADAWFPGCADSMEYTRASVVMQVLEGRNKDEIAALKKLLNC